MNPKILRFGNLMLRSPCLEISAHNPKLRDCLLEGRRCHNELFGDSLEYADALPSPRIIKSHLPIEFLPPNLLDTCKGKKNHY